MPPLLQIVLSNALMATALGLVVATYAYIAHRPALTRVLWLLVLLKLITPLIIPLPAREVSSSAPDTTAPLNLLAPSASETDGVPASDPRQEVTLLIYPAADSANLGRVW